ncbi:MAG: OmpA family protein [Flavobacteriales bacterium]
MRYCIHSLLLLFLLLGAVSSYTAQTGSDENISFERSDFKDHFNDSLGKKERWRNWRHAYRNVTDWFDEGKRILRENPFKWQKALEQLKKAHEVNSHSASLHFNMGKCYLQSNKKFKALEHFKRAKELKPKVHPRIDFFLARGYHLNGKWRKAEKAYKEYRRALRRMEDQDEERIKVQKKLVDKRLDECRAGGRLVQDPIRVWVDNLGDSINTEYPEYGAIISPDESLLIFTSRRPSTTGGEKHELLNQYYEDVYKAERKANGGWSKAENFGEPVNTEEHDAIVSLSPGGKRLLIYRPGGKGCEGNLLMSRKTAEGWTDPEELDDPVNSDYFENSADFSFDGNKLYFISTRPEGNQGKNTPRPLLADNNQCEHSKDIWVVEWNEEDEEWTNLKNLGPTINTPYDEDGVYLHPDGKTIYFASQGHNNMGGFDIFKAKKTSKSSWSKPQNIGHPINTPDNDAFMVVGGSGRHGYYTSFRKDGFGEKDLYKITFLGPEKDPVLMTEDKLLASKNKPVQEEVEEPEIVKTQERSLTILKGKITDAANGKPLKANVKLLDNDKAKKISQTKSGASDGKYMVSLPAGKNYAIHVEKEDYLFHSENFNIPDSAAYQEVTKNIELKKIEIGKSIVLKNIFFDLDSASLRDASKAELERLITMLEEHGSIKIEISGHTDSQGSKAYNEDLSQRRAQSVVDYLVEHGISRSRLEAKGYGETQPIATNDTEEGRQKNRRTEFKVIEK